MERDGIAEELVEDFVGHLERRGRGSYTARSYRLGLADFSRWLTRVDRPLVAVSRRDVEAYIGEFAAGPGTAARASGVVDLATGEPVVVRRAARTVNHRLSVLASFFAFLIDRDTEGGGAWAGRVNPVPARAGELTHGMGGGGDAPPRRPRAELRRREPRELPAVLDHTEVDRLVAAAKSWRDKALLMLLSRSGQRIGDWSVEHGRHGVLGMGLHDLDRRTSTVVVRLKGARDEHRVPATAEFWRLFDHYLAHERRDAPGEAAWVGLRRGWPRPLTYSAFEAALRQLVARTGVDVTAHMFRHTVASEVVASSGVAAARELLGHRHIATTVDTYAHVDRQALVDAVAGVERHARVAARAAAEAARRATDGRSDKGVQYVFHYDSQTLIELDAVATPRPTAGLPEWPESVS
ncbi:tyrosine-type recombinase/integrase [Gordonia sp. UBA5067]|uniref:tyrosine-type recombinase/integrase n=1 Tax=Gordonia sp. UBA5067 TaxID=1946575 RepID=UPI0025C47B70|nr:tyrosine-type recombinase/integrase [Gordonia sp. UBA5067]